jgi:hypothetical protein
MAHGSAQSVRHHLLAELSYQQGLIRFIENHDEPRAALVFPGAKARAAAVALLTLPGARLLHEGQFEGRRVRLPVFLRRRSTEPIDADLAAFYARLLKATERTLFRDGEWRLCEVRAGEAHVGEVRGGSDLPSHENVLAWCWREGDQRALVVINFGPAPARARVLLSWDEANTTAWRLDDLLSGDTVSDDMYDRDGSELNEGGLSVELGPWQCHLLELRGPATRGSLRDQGHDRALRATAPIAIARRPRQTRQP